jgi:hypothetical protein
MEYVPNQTVRRVLGDKNVEKVVFFERETTLLEINVTYEPIQIDLGLFSYRKDLLVC